MGDDVVVAAEVQWNHNTNYHRLIMAALPQDCDRVLEVGCGEGVLAQQLSRLARHVTAIDRDGPTIALAPDHRPAANIDYMCDDFLTHPFEPESFDTVVSVAAIHHVGTSVALSRMQQLLRPGGTLAVVGLARSRHPTDLLFDLPGVVGTRLHRLTTTCWEASAPEIWPPADTYRQTRQKAKVSCPACATDATCCFATRSFGPSPPHAALPADTTARLFGEIENAINRFGGRFTMSYNTLLFSATRR